MNLPTATLLIVDDHPLYLAGLRVTLRHRFRVLSAASLQEALASLTANPEVDLILVDLHLPDASGVDAVLALGQRFPQVARVAMSGLATAGLPESSRQAGASGFIHKSLDADALADALDGILAGSVYFPAAQAQAPGPHLLSPREQEVLRMVATGQTNKEIARALAITERTVKAHVRAAFDALGAHTRTEAVRLAQACGLLTLQ